MGVRRYKTDKGFRYKIDERITLPDGTERRLRMKNIPSREMAETAITQARADAFDGLWFRDRKEVEPEPTLAELWNFYLPKTKEKNRSWKDDVGRASHLVQHLGDRKACVLIEDDVVAYRAARLHEMTPKGRPPKPATLNRETALLKRILSYAVENHWLQQHPLKGLKMLEEDNVRQVVVDEGGFTDLIEMADTDLQPVILIAYDTGMRKQEVLKLKWSQIKMHEGFLELAPNDTKTKEPRRVRLSQRTLEALRQLPRYLRCDYVFVNRRTLKPWYDVKKKFEKLRGKVGREEMWFHDLRRSFTTNARKAGVPESVVMKMTGHKTRSVFDRYNIVDDEDLRTAIERMEMSREVHTSLGNKTDTLKKRKTA